MRKILELVECVVNGNNSECEEIVLGNVHNYHAQAINRSTGVKLNGAEIVITPYSVLHIIKTHGNHKLEVERGQLGIINSDFEFIHSIVTKPDEIQKGAIVERNKQSILFIKSIKNAMYYVAMIVEGKMEKLRLVLRTMYKKPIKKGQH